MKLLLFCISAILLSQSSPNDQWKKLFNTNIDSIAQAYVPNAVLVTTSGTVHSTAVAQASFYKELKKEISQIKSVTTIHQEQITPDLSFEINYFISGDQKKFKQLIIGRKVNGVFLRELEITSEANDETADLSSINNARNAWMKLCNGHKASELVRSAYTDNAVYYNSHRVLVGTANITTEYRYMNNPDYRLTLTPIIVEGAGKNIAFEIGQCSGSYLGKYTLVWKKVGNTWKVLFDSN